MDVLGLAAIGLRKAPPKRAVLQPVNHRQKAKPPEGSLTEGGFVAGYSRLIVASISLSRDLQVSRMGDARNLT